MPRGSRNRIPFWIGVALVALYAVRAGTGWVAGIELSRGRRLARQGYHESAIVHLERGAAGANRAPTLWLRGMVREGIWELMREAGVDREQSNEVLLRAHAEFAEALSMSPAAGWPWAGLGDLYQMQEQGERFADPLDLALLEGSPWQAVGRPGRIAIGMYRIAIERENSDYILHDELVELFLFYDLRPLALEAVRRTAALQPDIYLHTFSQDRANLIPELLDAFAEGSRQALGRTPFTSRDAHLTTLGIVELLRGEPEQAERDLRAALASPIPALRRAEAQYHLGVALMEQGRHEESEEALLLAARHPNLERGSLVQRARLAEHAGRPDQALELWRQLQRREPRTLGFTLEFVRLARSLERWGQAEEALRWAAVVHPQDPGPDREIVLLHLARGDRGAAQSSLREYEHRWGESPELERLRELIGGDAPASPR